MTLSSLQMETICGMSQRRQIKPQPYSSGRCQPASSNAHAACPHSEARGRKSRANTNTPDTPCRHQQPDHPTPDRAHPNNSHPHHHCICSSETQGCAALCSSTCTPASARQLQIQASTPSNCRPRFDSCGAPQAPAAAVQVPQPACINQACSASAPGSACNLQALHRRNCWANEVQHSPQVPPEPQQWLLAELGLRAHSSTASA
jgi:hypothetical protein